MAPQDPLLSHLINRLEADVNFLSSQGHISSSDAQTVLGILSRAGSGSVESLTAGMRNASIGGGMPSPYRSANSTPTPALYGANTSPSPYGANTNTPSPAPVSFPGSPAPQSNNNNSNTAPPMFPGGPPSSAPPYNAGSGSSMMASPAMSALKRPVPPPPPGGVQAKALWDYNLDGQLKDDLTFRSGDIIQIVKEENADWWTGRINGKDGMFPSNHVEKLPSTPSPSYASSYVPSYGYTEKDQYQQPHQQYAPPPGPPATYQQGGPMQQQAPPEEEKKKGKFGKYGGLMAGSAAGGLGFGAGAAVGGGLINAIF